jgi:hypothetical protein
MLAKRVMRRLQKLELAARHSIPDLDGDPKSGGSSAPPLSVVDRRKIEAILNKLIPLLPRGRKLRVFDMCNGESTLLQALKLYLPSIRQRFEYVTLDSNPNLEPLFPGHIHICGDARDWKKLLTAAGKRFKPQYFDFCWGSPPCTAFSRANTSVSDEAVAEAVAVVKAMQDCFLWCAAPCWCIENPVGRLATNGVMDHDAHPRMADHVRLSLSYCRQVFRRPLSDARANAMRVFIS